MRSGRFRSHIERSSKTEDSRSARLGNVTALLDRAGGFDEQNLPDPAGFGHVAAFIARLQAQNTKRVENGGKDFVTLSTVHRRHRTRSARARARALLTGLPLRGQGSRVARRGSAAAPSRHTRARVVLISPRCAQFVVHFNEGVMPLPPRDAEAETTEQGGWGGTAQRVVADPRRLRAGVDPMEEERRLTYVALSRARQALFVSFVLSDQMGNPMVRASRCGMHGRAAD
jgi:superfamily I DNA/RNA helicase